MIKETRLWKNQVSSINGIPYIILPNTVLNHTAWDIQWSNAIQRLWSKTCARCPVKLYLDHRQ